LVHKVISLGKYLKCNLELNEDKHDHHNLICKKCGKLQEVHCLGLDLLERVVSSEYAFKVEYHALEFYGLCSDCNKNN
ncbi:MAG: Fur family transcriptional regulator, partial [Candidatus Sericytochromatia bacterium]